MALKVHDDLAKDLRDFQPQDPGEIKIYTCGVTTYSDAHLGHARFAVVWDTVRRYLTHRFPGAKITYVQNFTDIDDKIIQRANEAGEDPLVFAQKYVVAYRRDMARLGVEPPTHAPKATEYVPQMVAHIQGLIDKGLAYASGGDVYFEVRRFPGYGKLSGRSPDQMKAGARVDVNEQKKDPLDFALWKAAKPGEPSWESPWGPGRPGWHIECSVMARALLGDTLDVHTGGLDLTFPHHENEIAQSEGLTGHTFSNYWLHNGMVNFGGEKMSKSIGNVANVQALLHRYDPQDIRFFLLNTHYRQDLEFADEALVAAGNGLRRLRRELAAIREAASTRKPLAERSDADSTLKADLEAVEGEFTAGMDADFNTSRAIAALFGAARRLRAHLSDQFATEGLVAAVDRVHALGDVLGLDLRPRADAGEDPAFAPEDLAALHQVISDQLAAAAAKGYAPAEAPDRAAFDADPGTWVGKLVALRAEIKARHRDFAVADAIREGLKPFVVIQDKPDKTSTWAPAPRSVEV